MVSGGPGAPSANLGVITKSQPAGTPHSTSKPSAKPTRKPMLPLQALTAKIPLRLALPPPLQAVMMMRMRNPTQTMNRIK
eukprot:1827758-Ditylum_brightwellii.AAC.1